MIRAASFLVAWPSGELEPIFPGNRVYRISPIHAHFNYPLMLHGSEVPLTRQTLTVTGSDKITMPICVQ